MAEKCVTEKALEVAIDKMVGDKLSEVARNLFDLTRTMSETEKLEYKKLVLGMMKSACGNYHAKMLERM